MKVDRAVSAFKHETRNVRVIVSKGQTTFKKGMQGGFRSALGDRRGVGTRWRVGEPFSNGLSIWSPRPLALKGKGWERHSVFVA